MNLEAKSIKTDKTELLIVSLLKENADHYELNEGSELTTVVGFNTNGITSINPVPQGKYKIIGKIKDVTEAQAEKLITRWERSEGEDTVIWTMFLGALYSILEKNGFKRDGYELVLHKIG